MSPDSIIEKKITKAIHPTYILYKLFNKTWEFTISIDSVSDFINIV